MNDICFTLYKGKQPFKFMPLSFEQLEVHTAQYSYLQGLHLKGHIPLHRVYLSIRINLVYKDSSFCWRRNLSWITKLQFKIFIIGHCCMVCTDLR